MAAFGGDVHAAERSSDPFELAALVFDALLIPDTDRYTLDEVAAAAGVDRGTTQRLWRALGFPDPPPQDRIAGDMDVEALIEVTRMLEGPAALDNSVRQTRIYSAAVARIAELWVDDLRSNLDAGAQVDEVLQVALPQFDVERASVLLSYTHNRLLAAGLRRELSSRSMGETARERAVAFADLVGFTTISERLGPLGLSKLVETFEALAYDTVAMHGGRVVKTIGDEVLYTADEPDVVVAISEVLLEQSPLLDLPPLRIGAEFAGALWYEGDLYGPAVNRAARLVAEAAPGRIVATEAFAGATTDRRWVGLGPFALKGVGTLEVLELVPRP